MLKGLRRAITSKSDKKFRVQLAEKQKQVKQRVLGWKSIEKVKHGKGKRCDTYSQVQEAANGICEEVRKCWEVRLER